MYVPWRTIGLLYPGAHSHALIHRTYTCDGSPAVPTWRLLVVWSTRKYSHSHTILVYAKGRIIRVNANILRPGRTLEYLRLPL